MNRTGIRCDPAPTGDRSDSGQKDAASLAGDLSQRSPDRSPDSLEERHPGETMGSQLGRIQASVKNPAVGKSQQTHQQTDDNFFLTFGAAGAVRHAERKAPPTYQTGLVWRGESGNPHLQKTETQFSVKNVAS